MSRQSMPRSILKCSTPVGSSGPTAHPHSSVRFPSSPKLSTVHLTHCPSSYDRTPIVVAPNWCAMPERGCRSYAVEQQQQQFTWGRSFHPSAFNSYRASDELFMDPGLLPPGLSSDDGSSEDSDGIASPPPEAIPANSDASHYRTYVPSQSHLHADPLSHPPIPQYPGPDVNGTPNSTSSASDYSLSFLPHAPAISACSSKKSRDKTKHHREPRLAATATTTSSFSSSWGQSEESSCLGGF